ncbi:hypothetical protein R3Q06_30600 [Rhodococcus erythropolis]|uniref:hypothetical protein n=1 Tax=Rhodococcus erythropolis TaxID=1833 RepID=UPI002948FA15|nr:hypothetical protein [Rhodococcus erythropolis]MDV6277844.1 hypothetical protein [Rhodococcus erythropolis]
MHTPVLRRTTALAALLAAPILLGAVIGAGTANAQPWQVGPVYRAEFTGDAAQYLCENAAALEKSEGAITLVPCTADPSINGWYRVVVNPKAWNFGS